MARTWTGVLVVCVLALIGGIYRGFQDHFGPNVIKGIMEYRRQCRRSEAIRLADIADRSRRRGQR
jgi:hypothetical protein